MANNANATNPPVLTIATTDYPAILADMSAVLAVGETISSVETRLQVVAQFNRLIKLPDSPVLASPEVTQKVKGSLLTVGQSCLLIWILTLSSGDIISQQTTIACPY